MKVELIPGFWVDEKTADEIIECLASGRLGGAVSIIRPEVLDLPMAFAIARKIQEAWSR